LHSGISERGTLILKGSSGLLPALDHQRCSFAARIIEQRGGAAETDCKQEEKMFKEARQVHNTSNVSMIRPCIFPIYCIHANNYGFDTWSEYLGAKGYFIQNGGWFF
jgi:hypothetical protein